MTAASKIFELCLSVILEDYLITHDQQFGFKRKQLKFNRFMHIYNLFINRNIFILYLIDWSCVIAITLQQCPPHSAHNVMICHIRM